MASTSTTSSEHISVLFVCLGNICRSPMAEGIFRSLVSEPPYNECFAHVDSCGTAAYHTGSAPDERTMATLKENGIVKYRHAARKIQGSDFTKFDYIFAMDRENLRNLEQLQRRLGNQASSAKVMLFGEYADQGKSEEIEDPYYGGTEGFDAAYQQCIRFSRNFLAAMD